MASSMLSRRFSEMSNERDRIDESTTQATGYSTEEGYVQEVVSTAPPRISAATGEVVQVVTRRKTVTTLGPDAPGANGVTAPKLSYTSSAAGSEASTPRNEGVPRFDTVRLDGMAGSPASNWDQRNANHMNSSSLRGASSAATNQEGGELPSFYKGAHIVVGGVQNDQLVSPVPQRNQFYDAVPTGLSTNPLKGDNLTTRTPAKQTGLGVNTFGTQEKPPSALRSVSARPYGTGCFVQIGGTADQCESRNLNDASFLSPSRRSVTIGSSVDTRVIEPSRMSPLQPQKGYAPVRYITRGELRRMRDERGSEDQRETVETANPDFYGGRACVGGSGASRSEERFVMGGSVYPPAGNTEEDPFLRTERMPTRWSRGAVINDTDGYFSNQPSGKPSYVDEGSDFFDDDVSIASSAQAQFIKDQNRMRQRQGFWVPRNEDFFGRHSNEDTLRGRYNTYYRGAGESDEWGREGFSSGGNGGRVGRSGSTGSEISYNRLGVLRDGDRERARLMIGEGPYRPRPQFVTGLRDIGDVGLDIEDVAEYLISVRQLPLYSVPSRPSQAPEAFKVISRGTYLIKYNKNSQPHERFFALRTIPDETTGKTHPYLVWALHDKSAAFKSRIHLSYLMQAVVGVTSEPFRRMLTGKGNELVGPFVGSTKCTVSTNYAMTFAFRSASTYRTVDVVALDDQTFRCWMIVMSYFASINASEGGKGVASEIGTLAPDTPRSQSQMSQF